VKQPESKLKDRFDRAFLSFFGGRHDLNSYHTSIEGGTGQRAGIPDRFYTALGGHAFVEAKIRFGAPSRLQHRVCERLARGGCRVLFLWSTGDASLVRWDEFDRAGRIRTTNRPYAEWSTSDFWHWLFQPRSPQPWDGEESP